MPRVNIKMSVRALFLAAALVLLAHRGAYAALPVLFGDAVPGAARQGGPADLLVSWEAAMLKGATLVLLSTHDGFFDPDGERPQAAEIRSLLSAGKQQELHSRALPFPLKGRLLTPRNFVHAAWALGYVKELVWVVPRLRSLTMENFKSMQGHFARLDAASAQTLQFRDGVIRGAFLGMPVRICTILEQAELAGLEAAVAINTDYFSSLYESPMKASLLALLSDVAGRLQQAKIRAPWVGLTDTFYGGLSPLYHDFVGDALLSLLHDPGFLEQPVDERWLAYTSALKFEALSAVDESLDVMLPFAEAEPGDAYPQYFVAMAFFRRKRFPEAIEWLNKARERDGRYLMGFVELSVLAQKAGNSGLARCLLEEAAAVEPEDPTVLYMLGNTALHDQRWADAVRYYERFTKATADYREIRELVAKCRAEKRPDKGLKAGKASGRTPCGKP